MAEETSLPEQTESQAPATTGGRSRLLGIAALVIALGAGGGVGYAGMKRVVSARKVVVAKATPQKKKAEATALYLVENLVVNPADSKGSRFLIVTVALQPKKPEVEEDLKRLDPELRDAYSHILGGLTIEQLSDIGRRDSLKQQLQSATETVVGGKQIEDVFLPQFVLQ